MLDLDYEQLASDWIRALRAHRSQPQLSRMLGYNSNVLYSWEAGRRFPAAEVALQIIEKTRGSTRPEIWSVFFSSPPNWESEIRADQIAQFLRELKGDAPILDIAEKSGFSRFAISRWLRGLAQPRIPDFFRLIEAMSMRLLDFLSATTDVASLPSAADAWSRLERARRIAFDLPWSHAVLRVLELDTYRERLQHDERFVAQMLGIPREAVRESIEALSETGQIRKEGKHWVVDSVLTVDTRRQAGDRYKLKSWWSEVGLDRIPKAQNGQFSYNLFTVSNEDFEKIRALHLAYFRAMRAIVSESSPAEKVAVVNVQLFDLSDL